MQKATSWTLEHAHFLRHTGHLWGTAGLWDLEQMAHMTVPWSGLRAFVVQPEGIRRAEDTKKGQEKTEKGRI